MGFSFLGQGVQELIAEDRDLRRLDPGELIHIDHLIGSHCFVQQLPKSCVYLNSTRPALPPSPDSGSSGSPPAVLVGTLAGYGRAGIAHSVVGRVRWGLMGRVALVVVPVYLVVNVGVNLVLAREEIVRCRR